MPGNIAPPMSARAANCPNCGSEVRFSAGSSLVTVCPSCRSAVARRGVNLEAIGKVAELTPTSSPFRIGMDGKPKKGFRPFRIVGRLQLATSAEGGTGRSVWDEWHVVFDDGRSGWLAEAQGSFYLMKPMPTPEGVPELERLAPGQRLDIKPYGVFAVAERRAAQYSSAEGELPFDAAPLSIFRYADLSGPEGSFATLDYGADPGVDAFYVGVTISLEELGIPGLTAWADRQTAAKATALNCPNCGGPLEIRDPKATVRMACVYCGAMLGAGGAGSKTGKFELLERLKNVPFKPSLPIGSAGTLNGHVYVILGAVRKFVNVDGTHYYWTEYLLKDKASEGFHWLAESNGHFTVLKPVPVAAVVAAGRNALYSGRSYKHFTAATATVEAVLGEFYWEVYAGEMTTASDYVAPPRMLSQELAGEEVNWTEGVYVTQEEVLKAFAPKEPLPPPTGVGANQPWPGSATFPAIRTAWLTLSAIAIALYIFFGIRGPKKVVYEGRQDLTALAALPEDDRVILTEPFQIPATRNIEARIDAPTDNSWVSVEANLIDQATGEVRSFVLGSDYYYGSSGGESWSEGSRSRTLFLSRVPLGTYVLRLQPEFEVGKGPSYFDFRLRCGVPRFYKLFWTLFFLGLGPIFMLISYAVFEGKRWAESDYATTTSDDSGGDE